VTRLLFHEAAFYTPSPLTKKDFDKLLTAIERMASSLPENLYLLLSSFPVAINENHYVNQVVHVQCGAVPKLTIFTKITPSGFDPLFPNMKCIHYSSEKRKPVQDDLAMSVLPDNENTPVIDYSCTLKCQTSGGAEFFSVIEICKDHFFKEGYKSLNKQIDLMTEPRANELIPRQLLHTITSNWIDFVDDSMLTNKIVRADPIKGYDFGNHIPLVSLSAAFRAKVLQTSLEYQEVYKKMNLIMDSEVISIVNPPFGPPLTLFFYEAHQLSVLPADFLSRVDQHNERVIQQYSYQNCLLFNYPSAIIKEEKKEKGIKLTVKRVG